jgi:hypothetical protein
MFSLLPIDVHDMNKRFAKISFLLTKRKRENVYGLKCATNKIMPTQATACALALSLLMSDPPVPR